MNIIGVTDAENTPPPREDAGGLSRENVLRIPGVS